MCLQRKIVAPSCNHCCWRRALSVTYSACVSVASVIQNTMRVHHIIIYVPSGSTIFFLIIPQTARFSGGGGVTEHKMRVLIFYTTLPEKFLVLRRTKWDMIKNIYWSDTKETWIIWTDFREKYSILNFMKIHPMGAELLHADRRAVGWIDGRTDRHGEANNRFSQFYELSSNFKSFYFLFQWPVRTHAAQRSWTFKSPVLLKSVDLQKLPRLRTSVTPPQRL
jgi:hypothetical protein